LPCARSSCGQTTTRNRRTGSAVVAAWQAFDHRVRDRGRRRTGVHSAPDPKRCAPDAASTETARWSSDAGCRRHGLLPAGGEVRSRLRSSQTRVRLVPVISAAALTIPVSASAVRNCC
jgi:hypothetical protein